MKTAVQTGIREIVVRDVPDPTPPYGGLVLRVEACGICGSDLRRWKEPLPAGVDGFTPGHEVAGTVIAVGEGVLRHKVGDRLAVAPDIHCGDCWYCRHALFNLCENPRFLGISPAYPGGLAEQVVIPRDMVARGVIHRIDDGLSSEIAAMAEPCASVLSAHEKAGTKLNDTVVVIGAGPIGCLLAAVARARGARTLVVIRSSRRRAYVERFHPDAILDNSSADLNDEVRKFTDGLGADIVICANSDAATQQEAVTIVRKGGKVVLFGGLPKSSPMTTLNGNLIHYGEIEVLGAFSYPPTAHALALELFARGVLPIDQLITHRFPLSEVSQAFEVAASGNALKVIVEPQRT